LRRVEGDTAVALGVLRDRERGEDAWDGFSVVLPVLEYAEVDSRVPSENLAGRSI
jgi:hypothetical protein